MEVALCDHRRNADPIRTNPRRANHFIVISKVVKKTLPYSLIKVSVDIQVPENPPLMEETHVLYIYPMLPDQFACYRQLLTQEKKVSNHARERQKMLNSLLQIATRPVLVALERLWHIDFAFGKFSDLQSLVRFEFDSTRKVAVVCASPMLFRLVSQYFLNANPKRAKFDAKYQKNIVRVLNASDGSRLRARGCSPGALERLFTLQGFIGF
jgi:hypothetical protein